MALIPVIIPIAGGIIVYCLPEKDEHLRGWLAPGVVMANFLVVCLLLFLILEGRLLELEVVSLLPGLSLLFKVDPMGLVFALTASFLWLLAVIYATGYMSGKKNQGKFFSWYVMSMSAALGVAFAGNLFTLYVFFEILTLTTYPLVVQEGGRETLAAGTRYMIYCLSGGALILVAFFVLQGISPGVEFAAGGIAELGGAERGILYLLLVLLIAGFGTKAAVLPLHSWLPGAMVAPAPVSALFHAVAVVKSGVFGIVRLVYYLFNPDILAELDPYLLLPLFFSVTIIVASIQALRQDVLKLRLAYSTISQLGYISLGVLLFSPAGMLGGVIHIINHALLKIILFFCAGIIIKETGKSKVNELAGVGKRLPWTMLSFAVGGLGLIGIIPINGYISKLFILQGSLEAEKTVFALVILVSSLLNAMYYLPVIFNAFFKKGTFEAPGGREARAGMLVPTMLLAFLCLFFGFFAHKTTIPLTSLVVEHVF